MTTLTSTAWQASAHITLPSLALTLCADAGGGVWAGGPGGLAHWHAATGWTRHPQSPTLTAITALAASSARHCLIVGGTEGLALWDTRQHTWKPATMQGGQASIFAIDLAPTFAESGVALAATYDNGIMRTEDGGATWTPVLLGLDELDMTAVHWIDATIAVAGSIAGWYVSRNAGRSWRRVEQESATPAVAFAIHEGQIYAAAEGGVILHSHDQGRHWETISTLDDEPTDLIALGDGMLLMSTSTAGAFSSTDGGQHWTLSLPGKVWSLAHCGGAVFAGMADSLARTINGGQSWVGVATTPLHDIRTLIMQRNHTLLLAGRHSGMLRVDEYGQTSAIDQIPTPISVVAQRRDGALFVAHHGCIARSLDNGATWETVFASLLSEINAIVFDPRDHTRGWASSGDATRLLRTENGGTTWELLPTPFGVLPVLGLQAFADLLVAIVYNPRQSELTLWTSEDDGSQWARSAAQTSERQTICACAPPPLLGYGRSLIIQDAAGNLQNSMLGADDGDVRQIAATGKGNLVALTTAGVLRSVDGGGHWSHEQLALATHDIVAIATDGARITALSAAGTLYHRGLLEH